MMASISSNKRNHRTKLATTNSIYLPTPYTTPPLQRQCLSDSLQSFNPSHGSGSSSWMLWRDPNSPAYYQRENKSRICGVLLAVVVFLVIIAVLAIAGLAVYMGALRIDTGHSKNNTKQLKFIKDDRSLEIRNGVLRKVSSNANLTTPLTIHLKKINSTETESAEDFPVIEGSFRTLDAEPSKEKVSTETENETERNSSVGNENSKLSPGISRGKASNVTVDDLYVVGGVMVVTKKHENVRNSTKATHFERQQSDNIPDSSAQPDVVAETHKELTSALERESERSYSQSDGIKINSSSSVEPSAKRTELLPGQLPPKSTREKDQALLQVIDADTKRLSLQKHENMPNILSSSTKLPPSSTESMSAAIPEEISVKQGSPLLFAESEDLPRGIVSSLPVRKPEPASLPSASSTPALSNETTSTSISDTATFQTRFPPRQRVTVLPDQRNASHNLSESFDFKNDSSADNEEEVKGVDLDPNSMLRRMGPIHPAPEQDVSKGSQIRYADPSQAVRVDAMILNPAGPPSQNNAMNPTVLSTNTYKDRYQHLSAGSKMRPHYATKIIDAQVSKGDMKQDKNTNNSDRRNDGMEQSSAGTESTSTSNTLTTGSTQGTSEDGWRPMVPSDFVIVSHRPDIDQHEHTSSQTSDQLSPVHLRVKNANQDIATSLLNTNINGSISFTKNNSSSTDSPGTLMTAHVHTDERNISKSNAAEVIRKIIADSFNWPELPIMQQFSNLGNFLRKDDKPNEFAQPQSTKIASPSTEKTSTTSTTVRYDTEEVIENHGIALPVDSLPAELLIEEKLEKDDATKAAEALVVTLKPPKSNSGIGRPLRPRPKPNTTATGTTSKSTSTSTTTTSTTTTTEKSIPQTTTKSTSKVQQRPTIYSITTVKTSKITPTLKSAVRSNRNKTTTPGPSTLTEVVTKKSVQVSFSDDKPKKNARRNDTTHYVKINVRQESKVVPDRANGVGSHNAYHILAPKTVTTRPKHNGPVRVSYSNSTVRINAVPSKRRNGTASAKKPASLSKANETLAVVAKSKNDPSNIPSKITETNFYPVTYFPLLMNSTKNAGESHRHPKMSTFNNTTASETLRKASSQPTRHTTQGGVAGQTVAAGTEIRMSLEDIVRNYRTKITSSQNSKSNRNYSITYDELQEKQNANAHIESASTEEVSVIHYLPKASVNKSQSAISDGHSLPEPTQNTPKVILPASSKVQDRTVETKPSVTAHYILSPSNSDSKPLDLGTSKLFQNYPKIIQSFSPGMQNSAIGIRNSSSEKYTNKLTTNMPVASTTKDVSNHNNHRTNQTAIENKFAESFHSSYKDSTKYSPTITEKITTVVDINKPSHRENDKDMNYEAFKDLSFPLEDAIVNAISKFATVHVSAVVKNTSLGMFNSQNANTDISSNNVTEGSINMPDSKEDKLPITGQKEWSKINSTWTSQAGAHKENSSEQAEKLLPNFTLNQNGIPILTKTYTKATDTHLLNMNETQDEGKTAELSKNQTECTGIVCGDNECVSIQSRCNQLVDCSDGADEKDCTCADYLKAQYLTRKLCDGVVDCWDFTDENNCEWCSPGQFVCPNSQMCIDREKLCDGNRDCPYGDDEKQCVTIAPTLSNATDFPYHQEGYLMVRKQGKWGKLCLQNFNSVVSDSHTTWEVKDLGKAVCKAMTFSDFDRVERMVDTTGRSEDSLYYELSYAPEDTNTSTARSSLTFHESPCAQKEVVHVKCRDLECGIRPQAVSQWARSRRSRIVGGGNSGPGSWPWQAALYKEGEFQCGATLISEQWLVSAGHCFYHALDDYWVARLGTLRRGTNFPSPYEQLRPISNIILHPRYVDSGFINDISLLRMKEPVAFSDYVRPICLPQPNSMLKDGKLCTVVGWGQLFEVGRIFPDTLQEVQLPIISTGECRKRTLFLPLYRVTDNMFCAGFDRGGRDACLGDSGGPLMCQEADGHWSLYGVTSNGYGCARANRPGVYTKVAKYVVWIRTSMNLLMQLRESKAACKGHRCPLGECLPRSRVCNGYMECSDGSDEKDCW